MCCQFTRRQRQRQVLSSALSLICTFFASLWRALLLPYNGKIIPLQSITTTQYSLQNLRPFVLSSSLRLNFAYIYSLQMKKKNGKRTLNIDSNCLKLMLPPFNILLHIFWSFVKLTCIPHTHTLFALIKVFPSPTSLFFLYVHNVEMFDSFYCNYKLFSICQGKRFGKFVWVQNKLREICIRRKQNLLKFINKTFEEIDSELTYKKDNR